MKTLLIIFSILLMPFISHTQNLELQAYSGYSFERKAQHGNSPEAFFPMINTTWVNHNVTEEPVNYSLAKGIPIGVSLMYQINNYLSTGLSVNYIFSDTYSAEFKSNMAYSDYTKLTLKGRYFDISPKVEIRYPFNNKWSIFTNLGLNIAFAKVIYSYHEDIGDYPDETVRNITNWDLILHGGTSLGYSISMGSKFQLTKHLGIMASLSFTDIKYTPKEAEYTSFSYNGNDYLDSLTVRQRYFQFMDTPNENTSSNEPRQLKKYTFPFHNWGINVGFIYLINVNKE